jgi:polyisoprenoid-binding protein YceI
MRFGKYSFYFKNYEGTIPLNKQIRQCGAVRVQMTLASLMTSMEGQWFAF